jgi:uncharacterized protein YodC (DUF2158 family)
MAETWTVRLERLDVLDADEDGLLSDGDEPYLIALGFRSRLSTPGSTQVWWSGVLDDDWAAGTESGGHAAIPESMGKVVFDNVDRPNAAAVAAGQVPEILGTILVVMESDATPFDAVRDKMNELKSFVSGRLIDLVEHGTINLADPGPQLDQITRDAKDQLEPGVFDAIVLFLESFTDPDDLVGTRSLVLVAGDASLAGQTRLPLLADQGIDWEFENGGIKYKVTGRVERKGWRDWYVLDGAAYNQPAGLAAVSRFEGNMEVFATGMDGMVRVNWFDGQWRGWYVLDGAAFAQSAGLAAVSRFEGNMEVFATGMDGMIRVNWFDGQWRGWYVLDGAAFSQSASVAVVSRFDKNMEVFAVGQDGMVRVNWFDGQWRGWYVLDGARFSQTAGLAAVSRYNGHMEVLAVGEDGVIRGNWFDGQWRGWYVLERAGFSQDANLAAVSRFTGNMELFATGQDGMIRVNWYAPA